MGMRRTVAAICWISLITISAPAYAAPSRAAKDGVTVFCPTDYFANVTIRREAKNPDSSQIPLVFPAPEQRVISLDSRVRRSLHPGRYYYPSYNVVFITPLTDQSVKNFSETYRDLVGNAKLLEIVLKERPIDLYEWQLERWKHDEHAGRVPDYPNRNAAACLLSKFRILRTDWGEGCRFLTYYRNGQAGYGAVNDELFYNFQGKTSTGAFYISARLAVQHPKLPETMDDPRAKMDETDKTLRAEHERIDRWKDDSFYPKLSALDAMLATIQIN